MNLYDYQFTFKRSDNRPDIVGFGSIQAENEESAYNEVEKIANNNYQANLRFPNGLAQTQVNLNIKTLLVYQM